MTPDEQLLTAAKRAVRYLDARIKGAYIGDHEDIFAGRELVEAITAVEQQARTRHAQVEQEREKPIKRGAA